MSYFVYIAGVLLAYLTGSVPVAYVLVKTLKGVDIRTVGSGNVGATNAGRVLGKWGFTLVLFLDALKGFIPVYIALHYFHSNSLALCVAVAVILGHTFPVYLKFKGGKGVATSLGVFLALAPYAVLVALIVFILVVFATRMISAGSIIAAVVMSVVVIAMYEWKPLWYFTLCIAAFVIFKHRANISRIFAGTENKVNFKK